jgi:hypothetical protein
MANNKKVHPMKSLSLTFLSHRILSVGAISAVILVLASGTADAQATDIPKNAYETDSSYGDNWDCKRGFIKKDRECIKIAVPENGRLNDRGDRWECRRGFKKENGGCAFIKVPENAFLTKEGFGGVGWTCERGYFAKRNRCEKITVPKNAYLSNSAYGRGWVCDWGYRRDNNTCTKIDLPENAHIGYDGNSWECDKLLVKRQNVCVKE